MSRTTLVLATNNRGKVSEFRALLEGVPVDVAGLSEVLHERLTIVEDGATFHENALKKALGVARLTRMLTLADDSGLEVDALGGRPGVRSARFAGERATDAENNAMLLAELAGVPEPRRTARFRCVLVLIDPFAGAGVQPTIVEGTCEGAVLREPRGAGGFGYDPLFVVEGRAKTMAELTDQEKNQVSHRARALEQMKPRLRAILRAYEEHADGLLGRG